MTNKPDPDDAAMLLPSEAAQMLRVSTRTLIRMVEAGQLSNIKLPSGHRRYKQAEIDALREPAAIGGAQ